MWISIIGSRGSDSGESGRMRLSAVVGRDSGPREVGLPGERRVAETISRTLIPHYQGIRPGTSWAAYTRLYPQTIFLFCCGFYLLPIGYLELAGKRLIKGTAVPVVYVLNGL